MRGEEEQAHFEIYGYDDPYFDINDSSIRSEKVKCYLKGKKIGVNLRRSFIEMNKKQLREQFEFI